MKHKKQDKEAKQTLSLKPSEKPVEYYFEHEPLRDALFFIQDMLERSSLPFMLIGNTAKQLFEQEDPLLYDTKIKLGIKKRDIAPSGIEMLKGLLPQIKINDEMMFYLHTNGVPVFIKLLDQAVYFDNPDPHFYYQTQFNVPNPFVAYWDERGQND